MANTPNPIIVGTARARVRIPVPEPTQATIIDPRSVWMVEFTVDSGQNIQIDVLTTSAQRAMKAIERRYPSAEITVVRKVSKGRMVIIDEIEDNDRTE